MEQQPLVSVIINCYNGEKYLREAIDSVIAQTYTNWEIIFWDNQSTDSTAEIVKSYKDERIRYFYAPEHTPLGEARNLAMNYIDGSLFSFLDADDVWLPKFLEKGCAHLCSNDGDKAYYSNFYDIFPSGEKLHTVNIPSKKDTIKDLLEYYHICMSGIILITDVIKENGLKFTLNYNLIEDFDFYTRFSIIGDIYYDCQPLVKYRANFNSLSHQKSEQWYKEYCSYHRMLVENYVNTGIISEDYLATLKRLIVDSKVEMHIQKKEKYQMLITVVKNPQYLKYLWKKCLFLVVGKELYLKIRYKKNFVLR